MSLFGAVRLYVVGQAVGAAETTGLVGTPAFRSNAALRRPRAADQPRRRQARADNPLPRDRAAQDALVVPVSPVLRRRGTSFAVRHR